MQKSEQDNIEIFCDTAQEGPALNFRFHENVLGRTKALYPVVDKKKLSFCVSLVLKGIKFSW